MNRVAEDTHLSFDLNFAAIAGCAITRLLLEVLQHLARLPDVLQLEESVLTIHVLLNGC